ncbi:hypothetical protein GCM10025864_11270 [Luteimicrobium album]|uniref:Uncharacterized protein n=1 Tax=Luteimicrobium album TaxID=1054550 RepID=A0ABQ6HXY7_9MICO|nr:hypothetical protein GCM10025864_11270 [Luteimicrobium album]
MHRPEGLAHGLLGADALEGAVREIAAEEVADGRDAVVAALGDHVGRTELPGELGAVGVTAHGDDALRAEAGRGEDPAEPDRAVADDHNGRAGPDAGTDGRVVPGRHHVGQGEEVGDERVVDGSGDPDERPLREGQADVLALGAVDRQPVAVGAAEHRDVVARGREPGAAGLARAVGEGERRDDEVAGRGDVDVGAHLLDDADELVPDRVRRLRLADAPVRPQVGPADARGDHADDGVAGREDLRVGAVLDPDVPGSVDDGSAHEGPPGKRVGMRVPP